MDSLDQNRLVDRFMKYARVLSPTLGEIEFQRLLLEELSALGISAENDGSGRNGAGNLFAVVPSTEQSLSPVLFCMHTDTVECSGRIDPKIVDGRIQSDGTTILGADDKAAVPAMQEVLYWFKETRPPHGGLEMLFTWGEENGHQG